METKNLEREIDIEIIASIMENRFLIVETDEQKIKDFENKLFEECSFITGENVNFSNLYRFIPIIKSIIVEQYPFITKLNYLDTSTLDFMTINQIIRCYRTDYGDKLLVKSLKKGMVKSLKIQDK